MATPAPGSEPGGHDQRERAGDRGGPEPAVGPQPDAPGRPEVASGRDRRAAGAPATGGDLALLRIALVRGDRGDAQGAARYGPISAAPRPEQPPPADLPQQPGRLT